MGWGRRRPFDVESARKCIHTLEWARKRRLLDGEREVQTLGTVLSAATKMRDRGLTTGAVMLRAFVLSYVNAHPCKRMMLDILREKWAIL